jgi:hypothetical protein
MEGADEFIVRFWKTEAARLGMTIKEYQAQCQTTISGYDKLWAMAEEIEKSR